MSIFENARFVRFATLLAVALALLVSGVVVGAAGGPLIMGAANSAGITNTSLTTSSTGSALLVTQTSTGTALRGVATNGIAGFFQSANGSGVSGVVAGNTKYGVYGGNDAAAYGGGAAIRASGQQNHGVVATTANAAADALRGINTGGGQGLDLVVNAGVPPMSVNSDGLVTNLNADQLDGLDSTDFLQNGAAAGGDLSGTYPNPQLAAREAVQTPTLLTCAMGTNWTTSAAFAMPVGFWKDRSGVVHLQGSISCAGNATEGGVIFNLPAGYRPAYQFGGGTIRWAALAGGGTIAQIALLDSNGTVVYDGPDSTTADDYISLDGLTFRAEQ